MKLEIEKADVVRCPMSGRIVLTIDEIFYPLSCIHCDHYDDENSTDTEIECTFPDTSDKGAQ